MDDVQTIVSSWIVRRTDCGTNFPRWLAFPPLLDGVWNANPHALVLPLLVAGAAPVAILVKVYGAIVPAIRLDVRALAIAAALIVVTVPFVPWGTYLAERQSIQEHLEQTSGGGLSVWAFDLPVLPVVLAVAIVALVVLALRDRERAAWLAMPAFWPWTQWYYSSLAIPGLSHRDLASGGPEQQLASIEVTVAAAVAAAILAMPVAGGPVAALAVLAFGPPLLSRIRGAVASPP